MSDTPISSAVTPTSSYTEEFGDGAERTLIDPSRSPAPSPPASPDEDPASRSREHRTWPTAMLLLWTVVGVLVGMITALILLPDEQPVVLDDLAAQNALVVQQQEVERVNSLLAERDALIADLQAQLAAGAAEGDDREAQLAAREAAVAGREAEQDSRAAELDARQAELDRREQEVAAREQAASDGAEDGPLEGIDLPAELPDISLPDLGDIEIPDLTIPDDSEARGVLERLVDRLQGIFGLDE